MEGHDFSDAQLMAIPFNIDALLHDMPLARTSMSRQSSTSSFRARMGKVTKPGSAGNSPQHVQRRRTSASHRLAKYISDLYPYPSNNQRLAPPPQSSQPVPTHYAARPLSWHTSTMPQSSLEHDARQQQRLSLSLSGYQTVDMNGFPTPMTQPAMTPDLPNDSWMGLDSVPPMYPARSPYDYSVAASEVQSCQGIPFQGDYLSASHMPNNDGQLYFSPAVNSANMWPNLPGGAPPMVYTAPATPDMLPIQDHYDPATADYQQMTAEENDEADDGPELVGMGLYDAPTRPNFEGMGGRQSSLLGMGVEPTGKGLKLEETWEPPEEDEDDEDAASETSEDAENEEDDTLMQHRTGQVGQASEPEYSPVAYAQQTATDQSDSRRPEPFPKMYGDYASQTFFFEGNEFNSSDMAEPTVLGDEAAQMWIRAMMAGGITT